MTEWRNRSTEGRDIGRDRGEEKDGREKGGEKKIRCVRHKVYRRINASSDEIQEERQSRRNEGRNREERQR